MIAAGGFTTLERQPGPHPVEGAPHEREYSLHGVKAPAFVDQYDRCFDGIVPVLFMHY